MSKCVPVGVQVDILFLAFPSRCTPLCHFFYELTTWRGSEFEILNALLMLPAFIDDEGGVAVFMPSAMPPEPCMCIVSCTLEVGFTGNC
jgi:hypothetical protein